MTRDEMLVGWLCMYRMQMDGGEVVVAMPTSVRDELIRRGWIDSSDSLTDSGIVVSDLNAAEWEINAVEVSDD